MSELKGQILGIILVVIIFGAIATQLSGIFDQSISTISGQISETLAEFA